MDSRAKIDLQTMAGCGSLKVYGNKYLGCRTWIFWTIVAALVVGTVASALLQVL